MVQLTLLWVVVVVEITLVVVLIMPTMVALVAVVLVMHPEEKMLADQDLLQLIKEMMAVLEVALLLVINLTLLVAEAVKAQSAAMQVTILLLETEVLEQIPQ